MILRKLSINGQDPSGDYETDVTNVDANGLDWDGNTPSNSYTK